MKRRRRGLLSPLDHLHHLSEEATVDYVHQFNQAPLSDVAPPTGLILKLPIRTCGTQ